MSDAALPPLHLYPERGESRDGRLAVLSRAATAGLPLAGRVASGRAMAFARRVGDAGAAANAGDEALRRQAVAAGLRLRREAGGEALVALFASLREIARRTLGLWPHDVQLAGAWAMWRGAVAEMETGEGKTVTAALCAAAAALAGEPVHVVTVNDYLADRHFSP